MSKTIFALRVFVSVPICLVYLFFCLVLIHGGDKGFVDVVFYGFLVAGLIPLAAWLSVIFMARRGSVFRLLLFAVFITVYHYFLVGIAAHAEFLIYFLFQIVEIALLLWLLRLFRLGGE
ncbi:hypothetical protein [Pseudomonas entomophila]|uniref:hypothetical protein n=1 Tax=Pseudomonas entomophila TaxID=312306 RepID=UPI00200EE449|nr:hypothetical protein [Pseudomonas entomophila]